MILALPMDKPNFSHSLIMPAEAGDTLIAVPKDAEGNPAPYIPGELIDRKVSARHAGMHDIYCDLTEAVGAIDCLLSCSDRENQVIANSLLSAAIVSYGRCFAESKGRRTKLEPKSPWVAPDAQSLHFELMDLRNQIYAHSGKSSYRKCGTLVLVDSKLNPSRQLGLVTIRWSLLGIDKGVLRDVRDHIERIRVEVKEAWAESGEKLKKLAEEYLVRVDSQVR